MRPGGSNSVSLILPLPQAEHYHCQFEWFVRSTGMQTSNTSEWSTAYSTGCVLLDWLLVRPWQDESWHLWRKPDLGWSPLLSHCAGPDTSSTFLIRPQSLAPGRTLVCLVEEYKYHTMVYIRSSYQFINFGGIKTGIIIFFSSGLRSISQEVHKVWLRMKVWDKAGVNMLLNHTT